MSHLHHTIEQGSRLADGDPLRRSILPDRCHPYFSEGLPYGFVNELLTLFLRTRGVGLTEIGLLSTVGIAWTIKLFWASLVDTIGEYRQWIVGALCVIVLSLGFLTATQVAAEGGR